MPRRCIPDPRLDGLIDFQDRLVSRDQAIGHGLSVRSIEYRLRCGDWRVALPSVYHAGAGELSRRQMLLAALLYAGDCAAIDGTDACRFYGLKVPAVDDDKVHVVEPWGHVTRSHGFVVIRRTVAPFQVRGTERLRYVEPAVAVIAATRRMRQPRSVLAAMSEVLQRNVTTYDELVVAHVRGPRRNARHGDAALGQLGAGVRSAPEADFMRLASASLTLPPLVYNAWLRLPAGELLCADALAASSALIHETNGAIAHRRQDLWEDTQRRHDLLTAAGFCVLHNTPNRIRRHSRDVITEVERCHERYAGRGLPPGVTLADPPTMAA